MLLLIGGREEKNAYFALKIAFLDPKFPKNSLKFFREGQSAFFGSQGGGTIFFADGGVQSRTRRLGGAGGLGAPQFNVWV